MSDYYEKYWKQEGRREGVACTPPEWNKTDLRNVLNFLAPYMSGKVLDFGCGEGILTTNFKNFERVGSVIGVDVSNEAICRAKARHPGIEFLVSQDTHTPFGEKYFDVITMIDVVEHIVDIEGLFLEANRVLKDNGKLIITTTDFNWPKKMIVAAFFWEKYFYPTNPHIRFFTRNTLNRTLEKAGFKTMEYKWHGSYFGLMPKGQMVAAVKKSGVL